MKIPLNKIILAGFAALMVALLGIGGLSYVTTTRLIGTMEAVTHGHVVIATLAEGLAQPGGD